MPPTIQALLYGLRVFSGRIDLQIGQIDDRKVPKEFVATQDFPSDLHSDRDTTTWTCFMDLSKFIQAT